MILHLHRTPAETGPLDWVVPVNQTWQLLTGHLIVTTSATAGQRRIGLQILDTDSDIVWDCHAGFKQNASIVREYRFSEGGSVRETQFIDTDIIVPIPRHALALPGYTVSIHDHEVVDAANDLYEFHGLINVINSNNPKPSDLL